MKLARIYIKPTGEKWFDLPLRSDQDLGTVFQALRSEGVIMMQSAFCIPNEQVHHLTLLQVPDPPADAVVPLWAPSEGKPN